jgi:hypothetical protein
VEEPYLSILSSLLSGLIGAAVVYYFGIRQDARQRRLAFLERQLTEFYAPLAGLRKQIRAKSELREKVFSAAAIDAAAGKFPATIEYYNKQFLEELVPKYREMLALFTERYHLADAETRTFYPLFLEYVEIWNLWLAESIAAEAVKSLDHREEKVKPFYEHLERKMQQLQDEIARG